MQAFALRWLHNDRCLPRPFRVYGLGLAILSYFQGTRVQGLQEGHGRWQMKGGDGQHVGGWSLDGPKPLGAYNPRHPEPQAHKKLKP